MSQVIAGTVYETLFNKVVEVYKKHGYRPDGWQGWSSLNEYYPCHLHGDFIKTDETGNLIGFSSHLGSHPCLGGGLQGRKDSAFAELKKVLKLELADDIDGFNSLTYPGHRVRYWKIANLEFSQFAKEYALPISAPITDSDRLAKIVEMFS